MEQKSTPTKPKENESTYLNTGEIAKENSPLINREKIEGTPFWLIGILEQGWFIVMGDQRLTEPVETKEQALKLLQTEHWQIMMNMVVTLIETGKKIDIERNKIPN